MRGMFSSYYDPFPIAILHLELGDLERHRESERQSTFPGIQLIDRSGRTFNVLLTMAAAQAKKTKLIR